jgi:hypothetical protein
MKYMAKKKHEFVLSDRRVVREGKLVLVCAVCGAESKDHD